MTISTILTRLHETAESDPVSVGALIDRFGTRAYGPLFFLIGLVSASPVGAIPGASILFATLVIVIGLQMLWRKGPPWTPVRLRNVTIGAQQLENALNKMQPILRRLERVTQPRFTALTDGVAHIVITAALLAMAAMMYPLAIVPWGVTAPSLAIALLGLGLALKDGIMVSVGLGVCAGSVWLGYTLLWT